MLVIKYSKQVQNNAILSQNKIKQKKCVIISRDEIDGLIKGRDENICELFKCGC